MPVAESPLNPVLETPDFGRLLVFTVLAVGALWVLFLVLTIVRYWSQRAQKRGNASGGLDLETLQRQRDAGNICQEEYERICGIMTGARAAGGANGEATEVKAAEPEETPPERPINPSGGPDGQPGRSESNGQG